MFLGPAGQNGPVEITGPVKNRSLFGNLCAMQENLDLKTNKEKAEVFYCSSRFSSRGSTTDIYSIVEGKF